MPPTIFSRNTININDISSAVLLGVTPLYPLLPIASGVAVEPPCTWICLVRGWSPQSCTQVLVVT